MKTRKCDTAKYKKRKAKERISGIKRKEQIARESAERYAQINAAREAQRLVRKAKQPLYQNMANLLTKRLCELEPRYDGMLKLREIFKMTSIFGINPSPGFPVLYNTIYENVGILKEGGDD